MTAWRFICLHLLLLGAPVACRGAAASGGAMPNTQNPPDFVRSVPSGAWGTDIDREETTVLTGRYALKFLPTEILAELEFEDIVVEPDRRYRVEIVSRSNIDPGDLFRVYVDEYDAAGTLLVSTAAINTEHEAINTWEQRDGIVLTSSTTATIRLRLTRSASPGLPWTWIVDRVDVFKHNPGVIARPRTAAAVPTGVWTDLDVTTVQHLKESPILTGGSVKMGKGGWWQLNASVTVEAMPSGKFAMLRVLPYGDGITGVFFIEGAQAWNPSSDVLDVTPTIAATIHRDKSDSLFRVSIYHNGGVSLNVSIDPAESWISLVHIE